MKKILITTAICLIGAASLMAQGRINFVAGSVTPIRISAAEDGSNPVVLGTASTAQFGIGPASTRISLYAGLTSGSLSQVLIGTQAVASQQYVTNTGSLLATAQGGFTGGPNLAFPQFDGTAPVYFQFVAESINGLYRGTSSIILVNLATGATPSTTVFVTGANTASTWGGVTMIPLTPVPEPSSMALAGLGAASLLIFRRRK